MRSLAKITALFVALAVASPVAGATLVPIPPIDGSDITYVVAINNSNVIAGSYFLSAGGHYHGFFGAPGGPYTVFDFDSVNYPGSWVGGINDHGDIVGHAFADAGATSVAWNFKRFADGRMVPVTYKGQKVAGILQGISGQAIAGERFNPDAAVVGLIGRNVKFRDVVHLGPDASEVRPRGLNRAGDVVGFFRAHPGPGNHDQGFLNHNGAFSVINYPDPNLHGTQLQGINNEGLISGTWFGENFVGHAFYYDTTTSTFTNITVPDADETFAFGLNDRDVITVLATFHGAFQPFLYCVKNKGCPTVPGSTLLNRDSRR